MRRWALILAASALLAGAGTAVGIWALRSPCAGGARICSWPAPLTVDSRWREAGIAIQIDSSEILASSGELRLLIRGLLTQRNAAALEDLTAIVRLLDTRGRELKRIEERLHHGWYPPLWQGDSKSFYINSQIEQVAERYVLAIKDLRTSAVIEHGAAPEMPIELPAATPPRLKLAAYVRKRVRGVSETHSVEKVDVAIENQGELPVRSLGVQLVALDTGGRMLPPGCSMSATLAWEEDAPMLPGDRRVVRLECRVRGRMAEIHLLVRRVSWSATSQGPADTALMFPASASRPELDP